MVVKPDGREGREVLLQAGQTARFTAETKFVVTLGNAGGVALSLNGTPLPPLGRTGQVVREVVLPQGAPSPSSPASPGR
jgi:cytoskeleton protein RodZ